MNGLPLVALLVGCEGVNGAPEIPVLQQPRFEVANVETDESCTKLLDYCVRVSCVVRNTGDGSGTANVDVQLLGKDGAPQYVESLHAKLAPSDTTTLRHEFREAKLLGGPAEARCVLKD